MLLSRWGCPIGELCDLGKLAEHFEKVGRRSFFVSSEVRNVPVGVAKVRLFFHLLSAPLIPQSPKYFGDMLGQTIRIL